MNSIFNADCGGLVVSACALRDVSPEFVSARADVQTVSFVVYSVLISG